jgi:D-alanyl-D-alanine carboxypeptidase
MEMLEQERSLDGLVDLFVEEMNRVVQGLGMLSTRMNNPHGLSDPLN